MKKYEEMKSSGLDWLGDIPSHWQVKRLKNIARINPLKNIADDANEVTTFLPMEKVSEKGEIDCSLKRPVKDLLAGFTYFEKNDIILAKITPCFENGKGAYLDKLDTPFGFGSTEFHVIRTLEKLDSTFLYYVTTSNLFRDLGEASMTGSGGQKRVPTSFVENFPLAFPPLHEQRAIADYLDRKTAQLDTLLAQKVTLLQQLHQQRQALINEAVTQGLDPAASRKPSGVAWLGDVPAHWEVKKLKYVAGLNSGNTITAETIEPEGPYPVLGGNGLRGYTSTFTHKGHYALIGRQGHLCGNINYGYGQFFATEHALVVSLKGEYETVWLGELLRTMDLGQYSQAAAQPGLSAERLMKLDIPVPPLEEQKAIVDFIEAKATKINEATAAIHNQIQTLKAYRQALISEVVTGKVDVRPAVSEPLAAGTQTQLFG